MKVNKQTQFPGTTTIGFAVACTIDDDDDDDDERLFVDLVELKNFK